MVPNHQSVDRIWKHFAPRAHLRLPKCGDMDNSAGPMRSNEWVPLAMMITCTERDDHRRTRCCLARSFSPSRRAALFLAQFLRTGHVHSRAHRFEWRTLVVVTTRDAPPRCSAASHLLRLGRTAMRLAVQTLTDVLRALTGFSDWIFRFHGG